MQKTHTESNLYLASLKIKLKRSRPFDLDEYLREHFFMFEHSTL